MGLQRAAAQDGWRNLHEWKWLRWGGDTLLWSRAIQFLRIDCAGGPKHKHKHEGAGPATERADWARVGALQWTGCRAEQPASWPMDSPRRVALALCCLAALLAPIRHFSCCVTQSCVGILHGWALNACSEWGNFHFILFYHSLHRLT